MGQVRHGRAMPYSIAMGEMPLRKAYLRSVIERVEVNYPAIRIIGDKGKLYHVIAGEAGHSNVNGVCSYMWKWRTDQNKTANTYTIEILR